MCNVLIFFFNSKIWNFGDFFLLNDIAHHVLASFGRQYIWGFLLMQEIRYESIVWVILGRLGLFSECRHFSCSSFLLQNTTVILVLRITTICHAQELWKLALFMYHLILFHLLIWIILIFIITYLSLYHIYQNIMQDLHSFKWQCPWSKYPSPLRCKTG